MKLAVAARTSLEKPASLNSATGVKLVPSGAASRVMPSSSLLASTSFELSLVTDATGV